MFPCSLEAYNSVIYLPSVNHPLRFWPFLTMECIQGVYLVLNGRAPIGCSPYSSTSLFQVFSSTNTFVFRFAVNLQQSFWHDTTSLLKLPLSTSFDISNHHGITKYQITMVSQKELKNNASPSSIVLYVEARVDVTRLQLSFLDMIFHCL